MLTLKISEIKIKLYQNCLKVDLEEAMIICIFLNAKTVTYAYHLV